MAAKDSKELDDLIEHIYTRIQDIMSILEEEEMEPNERWTQLKIAIKHMKSFMTGKLTMEELNEVLERDVTHKG